MKCDQHTLFAPSLKVIDLLIVIEIEVVLFIHILYLGFVRTH